MVLYDSAVYRLVATHSAAFLSADLSQAVPEGLRPGVFELVRNTLLYKRNYAAMCRSFLEVYGGMPRPGRESSYELKEYIHKVVCACVLWTKLAATQGVPAAEQRAALTMVEGDRLLELYRMRGRAFDVHDLGVSGARLVAALACIAAMDEEPTGGVSLEWNMSNMKPALFLLSPEDLGRLALPEGSSATPAIATLLAPEMHFGLDTLYEQVCAELRVDAAPNTEADVLPDGPVGPLLAQVTSASPPEHHILAINGALRVFRWWVDNAGELLFALGLKHLVFADGQFQRFDEEAMVARVFDAEYVGRELAKYARTVATDVARHVTAEEMTPAPLQEDTLPDFDLGPAPAPARPAHRNGVRPGRRSKVCTIVCEGDVQRGTPLPA
jgi:hypothetical protein